MAKNIGVRPPFNWGEVIMVLVLMVAWVCLALLMQQIHDQTELIAFIKVIIKVLALPIIYFVGRVIIKLSRPFFSSFQIYINWRLLRWYALKGTIPMALLVLSGLTFSSYRLLQSDRVVAEARLERKSSSEKKIVKKTVKVDYYKQVNRLRFQKQLCHERGFNRDDCWFSLEAIVLKETNGKGHLVNVGDGGPGRTSYCWYQINSIHRLSHNTMCNFEQATRWALANMVSNGYPQDVFFSIKKHNGGGPRADAYAREALNIMHRLSHAYGNDWDVDSTIVSNIAKSIGVSQAEASLRKTN